MYLTGNSIQNEVKQSVETLSDNECKSWQYLAGFIIHKLYIKFRYSEKHRSSAYYEQYVCILNACKIDHDSSQTLVNARDRGGLWKVNPKTQSIFINCEKIFRKETVQFTTKIICSDLV